MRTATDSITVIPSGFATGVEIRGVDLSRPMDETTFRAIETAFNEHGVVYFRGQNLAPEQQLAFTRRFGDIEPNMHRQYGLKDYPDIQVISNIKDGDGNFIGVPDAGGTWHSDLAHTPEPARCSILHALEIPRQDGQPLGDTLFSNVAAAYDALPETTKKKLEGLKTPHSYAAKHALREKVERKEYDHTKRHAGIPAVVHPLVRTHPFTGRKCLFVIEGECTGILGMPDEEALPLLSELARHSVKPEFQYHHKWQAGDVLMWDNCTVQHMARKDYDLPLRRLMHRTAAQGSAPF
jgi:taurine dioxygenase